MQWIRKISLFIISIVDICNLEIKIEILKIWVLNNLLLLNFIFYKNENTAGYIHETKCFTSVKVDMTGMGKDKILNINIGIEDTFEDLCAIASLQDESKDYKIK